MSELRDGENDTRGGSSETDVSVFTISPDGFAVWRRRDEGDAGREPGERVAERASVAVWRGVGWGCECHL